jgi:plastocyanin
MIFPRGSVFLLLLMQSSFYKMRRILLILFCLLMWASPVMAGSLTIFVKDKSGNAVSDGVVTLRPVGWDPTTVKAPQNPVMIDQVNETFVPFVQVAQVGGTVVFRNSDQIRHHVYSFSPIKPFEFLLASGQSSPALVMPSSGVVTIGCNIHDHMLAYLFVTDAWLSKVTLEEGKAVFANIPAGSYIVQTWHPRQKGGKAPQDIPLDMTSEDQTKNVTISVSASQAHDRDPERQRY